MNVYLQWLVIPPLAVGVLFFLWVQQSAILEERGENTPRSRREHVMNVLATCGIFRRTGHVDSDRPQEQQLPFLKIRHCHQ